MLTVGSGGWQAVAGNTEASDGRKVSSWRAFSARDSDRSDQALVIADAMTPFCGIGCVLFALVSAAQFAFDKTPGAWWSSALAALTSVVLGVAFILLRSGRGEFMRRHSLPFGAFVGTLVGLNPIVYIFGTQITYPAIGVLLVIVAVGGLVHDWVWAAVVILAIDVVWILCAVAWGIPVPPATFISQILKANALAIVLNVARTRTVLPVRAGQARGPPDGDDRRIDRSGQPARTARGRPGVSGQAARSAARPRGRLRRRRRAEVGQRHPRTCRRRRAHPVGGRRAAAGLPADRHHRPGRR